MSRAVQISLDIVVGDKCEVEYLGSEVADELNRRGYWVIDSDFENDVTDFYRTHHPELFSKDDAKWTDSVGGIYEDGCGWAPNGDFCGECSNESSRNNNRGAVMKTEQIELRKILTQMLADNGINRETIVPFVKEIISEKVEKAVSRIINETNLDSMVYQIIQSEIKFDVRNAVENKITRCFSNINVSVEMNTPKEDA